MKVHDDFKTALNDVAKSNIPEGTVWGIVKSVDWKEKTMIATSVKDGLDYFDVLLGLGYRQIKPKVGSRCLISCSENKVTSMFLIDALEVEEIILNVKNNQCIIKENETLLEIDNTKAIINNQGYSIKQGNESLKTILNDWITEVSKIIVVNGTTINVGRMNEIKQRLNSVLIS